MLGCAALATSAFLRWILKPWKSCVMERRSRNLKGETSWEWRVFGVDDGSAFEIRCRAVVCWVVRLVV